MQTNMLDEQFKSRLKDSETIPHDVAFNKERLYMGISQQISKQTPYRYWVAAVLVILLLGSGALHFRQYNIIQHQNVLLSSNATKTMAKPVVKLERKEKELAENNTFKLESPEVIIRPIMVTPLSTLPASVVTHQISLAKASIIHVEVPVLISATNIPETDESISPELDLPVYYESERLADNTSVAPKKRSFTKKLNKLFNN